MSNARDPAHPLLVTPIPDVDAGSQNGSIPEKTAQKLSNGTAIPMTTPNDESTGPPGTPQPSESEEVIFDRRKFLNDLRVLTMESHQFVQADSTELGRGIDECFLVILEVLEPIEQLSDYVQSRVSDYDLDDTTPANGYRSILRLLDVVSVRTKNTVAEYSALKNSFFFNKDNFYKKILCHSEAFRSVYVMLKYSETMMSWYQPNSLFPQPTDDFTAQKLFTSEASMINQYSFYGRCLGIQFCESLATIFRTMSILMASFSEMFYSEGRIINPLLRCGKYLIDPEQRAKRLVNISQYASAYFCKSFWLLGEMELMQRLPSFYGSLLAVSKAIVIQPEPLEMSNLNGDTIDIPIPLSHKGPAPLVVRLISSSYRLGMSEDENATGMKFPSDEIVIHCHGGGFVAQSSKSHEAYLRQWAYELDCPILSIDYSLAPESPYPRAAEEVFYAYCWALKNSATLGTTCRRIVFAGDSAGANIVLSVTQMCINHNIRIPDGVFVAYAPLYLKFVPSPSRLLCLVDPLLPFGFVLHCTKAYICDKETFEKTKVHERKLKSVILRNLETPKKEKRSGIADDISPSSVEVQGNDRPALIGLSQSQPESGIWARLLASIQKFTYKNTHLSEDDAELEQEIMNEAFQPCPYDLLEFDDLVDPLVSPFLTSQETLSKFPPVSILTTEYDPFLDDGVELAKNIRRAGTRVTLDVLPALSHGFLNFSPLSKESDEGSIKCAQRIKSLLRDDWREVESLQEEGTTDE